jgi:hypothetical protein
MGLDMSIRNARVKTTKLSSIISGHYFTRGYKDAKAGNGFDSDYDKMNGPDQWSYERGRQFFFATGGLIPTKCGKGNKRVNHDAIIAYSKLHSNNILR